MCAFGLLAIDIHQVFCLSALRFLGLCKTPNQARVFDVGQGEDNAHRSLCDEIGLGVAPRNLIAIQFAGLFKTGFYCES